MAKLNMSKLIGYAAPFEGLGITEEDFVPLSELLNETIEIIASKSYEKDNVPGVFIAFLLEGAKHYVATHSIGLVAAMTDPDVQAALDAGDTITARIVERESKKTGRTYIAFDDSEE